MLHLTMAAENCGFQSKQTEEHFLMYFTNDDVCSFSSCFCNTRY
jgi:hypothetical protein